jgi:hypothetical protein
MIEPTASRAFRRLMTPLLGAGVAFALYRYGRIDPARDPVAALRTLVMKHAYVRSDIPLDRLGAPCDQGDGDACTELGLAFASVKDSLPELQVSGCLDHALFARACERGSWRGCRELSQRTKRGGCPATDLSTARDVLDAACRRLVFPACDALGEL